MFKNGKIVGASLVSSCAFGFGNQFASADIGAEIVSDGPSNIADLTCEQLEKILDGVHWKAWDSDSARRIGNLKESEQLKKEVEYLVKKYGLDVFLMYENDLTPYSALFDLDFCEDLDCDANFVFGEKDSEIKKLVNLDAWYTKSIIASRNALRSYKKDGFLNTEGTNSAKKNLASFFTLRNVVRRVLALRVAEYGIKMEERLIGSGKINKKSNVSRESTKSNVFSAEKERSLVVAGTEKDENKDSSNWSFLDIVFAIKDKVKSLFILKEEDKTFVSKNDDLKKEDKVKETEFSLSLLVKRFLDFVRSSDSIGESQHDENKDAQKNSGNSSNSLVSGQNNLLTDGAANNN